jgi:hypothetical protein
MRLPALFGVCNYALGSNSVSFYCCCPWFHRRQEIQPPAFLMIAGAEDLLGT